MSDLFSPPSFIPGVAMVQLKRHLRDFRSLAERGDGFELQGCRVVELRSDQGLRIRLAKESRRSKENIKVGSKILATGQSHPPFHRLRSPRPTKLRQSADRS